MGSGHLLFSNTLTKILIGFEKSQFLISIFTFLLVLLAFFKPWDFPSFTVIKNLQEMQETRVWSLGQEDPLDRKWRPTPVFLLGKSHEQRNLVSYSPWSHKESDTADHIHTNTHEFSHLESVDSLSCSKSSHIFSSFCLWAHLQQ